jgi:hypothetical protein
VQRAPYTAALSVRLHLRRRGPRRPSAEQFTSAIAEALRQLHGLVGGAVPLEVLSFDPASGVGVVSVDRRHGPREKASGESERAGARAWQRGSRSVPQQPPNACLRLWRALTLLLRWPPPRPWTPRCRVNRDGQKLWPAAVLLTDVRGQECTLEVRARLIPSTPATGCRKARSSERVR